MDTFSIVRQALDKSAGDEQVGLVADRVTTIARVVHAAQTVADALTPADGGRYIVGFADVATAGTDLAGRRIIVSSKPIYDENLSLIEKAVVVATFVAHEIGHTEISRFKAEQVRLHGERKGKGYHSVSNLADDIILEPWMIDRYPILADAFAFTGLWVLRSTAKELPKREHGNWESPAQRFNTILSATRYGDVEEIVWATQTARDERDWGRAWSDRLVAAPIRDVPGFIVLCDELWERINERPEAEPEPEPEPGEDEAEDEPPVIIERDPLGRSPKGKSEPQDETDEEQDGEDDESEPEGDEPGGSQSDDPTTGDDDESESEDGEGEGSETETEDDTDQDDGAGEDAEGETEDDESDEGTDEGDDATDGATGEDEDGDDLGEQTSDMPDSFDEPEGETDGSCDNDGDDEGTDEGDSKGDDPSTDGGEGSDEENADGPEGPKGEGGGGDAEQGAQEPEGDWDTDWDDREVDQTTHNQSESQGDDEAVETAVREYESTERLAWGKHGTATVRWE